MRSILIAITLLCSISAHSETLVQLRNRTNTWLTNHVGGASGLVAKQNAYFLIHSNYWQGLITFSSLPAHTSTNVADTSPNRLSSHPTDQASSWTNFVPAWSGETFAAAAQVDTYNGSLGAGWSLTVWVKYAGIIYQRKKNFGPDTSTDFDWSVYDPTQ